MQIIFAEMTFGEVVLLILLLGIASWLDLLGIGKPRGRK